MWHGGMPVGAKREDAASSKERAANLARLLAIDFDHPVLRTYPGGPLMDPAGMGKEQMASTIRALDASAEPDRRSNGEFLRLLADKAIGEYRLEKKRKRKR